MNGSIASIHALLSDILGGLSSVSCEVGVFPPTVYIPLVSALLDKHQMKLGAQNIYPKACGAFTGEVSCAMLSEYHCRYVLVGHSERRYLFHESLEMVKEKYRNIKEHGMIPVLCVGETLAQRNAGQTLVEIQRQIEAVSSEDARPFLNSVIAYEPVWAIGTGLTPSPSEIQAVHHFIRDIARKWHEKDAMSMPILYGGSVNSKNAKDFFNMSDVDGALVGGASLKASEFLDIVKCIN